MGKLELKPRCVWLQSRSSPDLLGSGAGQHRALRLGVFGICKTLDGDSCGVRAGNKQRYQSAGSQLHSSGHRCVNRVKVSWRGAEQGPSDGTRTLQLNSQWLGPICKVTVGCARWLAIQGQGLELLGSRGGIIPKAWRGTGPREEGNVGSAEGTKSCGAWIRPVPTAVVGPPPEASSQGWGGGGSDSGRNNVILMPGVQTGRAFS